MLIYLAIFPLFLNILGGIGMIINDSEDIGIILIVATIMFIISSIFAILRKNILTIPFAVIGTVLSAIVVNMLSGVSNADNLVSRHMPTVFMPVLIAVVVIMNFLDPVAVENRRKKRAEKLELENRKLNSDEKII